MVLIKMDLDPHPASFYLTFWTVAFYEWVAELQVNFLPAVPQALLAFVKELGA